MLTVRASVVDCTAQHSARVVYLLTSDQASRFGGGGGWGGPGGGGWSVWGVLRSRSDITSTLAVRGLSSEAVVVHCHVNFVCVLQRACLEFVGLSRAP